MVFWEGMGVRIGIGQSLKPGLKRAADAMLFTNQAKKGHGTEN